MIVLAIIFRMSLRLCRTTQAHGEIRLTNDRRQRQAKGI